MKELTESGGKMAGGSFILKALRNNSDELGRIEKFESVVTSQADEIGDIVVDVVTKKGNDLVEILNEFKNWKSIPTNRYQSFTRQFTGYLTSKKYWGVFVFFQKGC